MTTNNEGCSYFDIQILEDACINLPAAVECAKAVSTRRNLTWDNEASWLIQGLQCIDLTTLSGDDTPSSVGRLCWKAAHPIRKDILDTLLGDHYKNLSVGAVCVYPARVKECVSVLKQIGAVIPVASVATGFPSGQYSLKTRIDEIMQAVEDGAKEIDVVINREFALTGRWKDLYHEVQIMKKACGQAHLKTILATGELGSLTNVYRASMACMMAGADFIKTSTGKETVNAITPVGIVMTRAIRDFYHLTGFKVGFKPAGGIRTSKDILSWQFLIQEHLGLDWLTPLLFRIGASSVLADMETRLYQLAYGRKPFSSELPLP